ncbi:MAG: hypothetical protein R2939_10730 [Kofleriaceae bacterium]
MSPRRRLLAWAPVGVAAAVLGWHALRFAFVTDDAYISFVFSRNLAEHGELTFNLGAPVEGYTNFLWTVLLGGLMWLGARPEVTSQVLGIGCGAGTLVVTWRLMRRLLGPRDPWAYAPTMLLAASSGFACWSSGGLETQLFTLLVTAAIHQYVVGATAAVPADERRPFAAMGALLALAAMTRPEGLLITALLGGHRLGHNLWRERRLRPRAGEWLALAVFLGVWAPWFAWRSWYYGWPFPNTYYVKAHGPWQPARLATEMWSGGWHYLEVWLEQTRLRWAALPALIGLLAGAAGSPRRIFASVAALVLATYAVYTASVGGDFMGLHRFIMPMFVLAAMVVALGLAWLTEYLPVAWRCAVLGVVLAAFAYTQVGLTRDSLRWGNFRSDRGIDTPAFLIAYTEDRATIGRAMAACFRDDDFSIVGGAGAQPYLGRMRGVDVFGLVSERIAHEEPRTRARAGHTKFGRDELLASYDPTFVFSCYDLHRSPKAPRLPCNEGFWLARGYEKVTMHIPGLRERGEYYTFLAKRSRAFQCPGRVP